MLLYVLLVLPLVCWAQFPAVRNTKYSLSSKTCCPNNCGTHGTCVSIRERVETFWNSADQVIVKILRDGPLGAFGPRDVGSVISGLCRCLRKFVHVVKDGEAMTAANVTLDSSPMQLVSV